MKFEDDTRIIIETEIENFIDAEINMNKLED